MKNLKAAPSPVKIGSRDECLAGKLSLYLSTRQAINENPG